MSVPTQGEREFAERFRLDPAAVAAARDVLNAIAQLPWPEPERVSLLSRLARAARADVGPILGRLALRIAPLSSFDQLIPIDGLAEKRVAGLVRALGKVDVATFVLESPVERDLRARLDAARAENAALRTELDVWRARAELGTTTATPTGVMRLDEVASSVASQTALAAEALQSRSRGLRLTGVEMRLEGGAAAVGGDVALDFTAPQGGSALNLSFVSSEVAGAKPNPEIPDVVGYTPALARRKLTAAGFEAQFAALSNAQGVVTNQTPGAGGFAPAGTVIRLLVR